MYPATATSSPTYLHLQNTYDIPALATPPEPTFNIGPFTFQDVTSICFFNRLIHSDSLESLYQHIINGTALAVSDGSFFPSHHIGACGWIVSTPDLSEWIQGGCIISGTLDTHSAYRAELGGLTGVALFFHSIIIPELDNVKQSIYCDCLSALKNITTSPEYIKSSIQHMDLVSIISALWSSSKFYPTPIHVKAHQDTSYNRHLLPPATQLNCAMDTFAKQIALHAILHTNINPPSLTSPLGFGTITCHSQTIHSKLQHSLYNSITHHNFISYSSKMFDLDPTTF